MFEIPHELTGLGICCALFKDACNRLGTRCLGYTPHTTESRKALEEALAAAKHKKEGVAK
jgi:hypothetical protein